MEILHRYIGVTKTLVLSTDTWPHDDIDTNLKSVVTPSSMKGRIVSDHDPNDRVYFRPPKPLDEMTPEERHEFAEETYEQKMKLIRGGDGNWAARRLG